MTNVPATQEPEGQFERLAARFLGDPAIIAGTGFGANPGLRVRNRIFAMLVRGQLVVKLPKARSISWWHPAPAPGSTPGTADS